MAAIEKLYGNLEQYDEFLAWAKANNQDLVRWFYERRDETELDPMQDRVLTLFPTECDLYLVMHCPIDWVCNNILDQYDLKGITRKDAIEQLKEWVAEDYDE